MAKIINDRDLVQEGRAIQEKFNKKMMNEFGKGREVHTTMEIYVDATERIYRFYTFEELITPENRKAVADRVRGAIKRFAEKNSVETNKHYFYGSEIHTLTWGYEMDPREFQELYEDLKNELSKEYNTQLFTYLVSGFTYTATGYLGTSIGKDKRKTTFHIPNNGAIGDGDEKSDEFYEFVNDIVNTRPEEVRPELFERVRQIMKFYLNNQQVLFKDTDWVSDLKIKIKDLFTNRKIRARSV